MTQRHVLEQEVVQILLEKHLLALLAVGQDDLGKTSPAQVGADGVTHPRRITDHNFGQSDSAKAQELPKAQRHHAEGDVPPGQYRRELGSHQRRRRAGHENPHVICLVACPHPTFPTREALDLVKEQPGLTFWKDLGSIDRIELLQQLRRELGAERRLLQVDVQQSPARYT